MSARHRPSAVRVTTARLAIALAASLATVVAGAPMAVADDDTAPGTSETPPAEPAAAELTDQPTDTTEEPPAPVEETPDPVEEIPEAPGTTDETVLPPDGVAEESVEELAEDAAIAADEVVPNYGTEKLRVGVQLADGSYVPDGASTAGSTITITSKLPGQPASVSTCITSSSGSGAGSWCEDYWTTPGATTTFRQTSAPRGIVRSTAVQTLTPCENDDSSDEIRPCTADDVVFVNTGLAPSTAPDSARTREGDAVTIDVLANDDSTDPSTSLAIGARPDHGRATVVGQPAGDVSASAVAGAGTLAIRYVPAAGFTGIDRFRYTLTNANGTTTGTVTVRVVGTGGGDGDDDADDTDTSSDDDRVLPDTGGADSQLLGYAALLLASGGALTVHGRRRRDALVG